MKSTLSTSQAVRLLLSDTNANWSPAGARALIEYLEDFESSQGVELELDTVALRCDYSEFDSALEAAVEYGFEPNPNLGEDAQDADDREDDALDWLNERTCVIMFDTGVIVASF
jgi:hypothetical protein